MLRVASPPDRSGAGRLSRTGVPGEVAATGRGTGDARAPARTSGFLVILAFLGAAEGVGDALVGGVGLSVDAVGVDLEQDGDWTPTGGRLRWRGRCGQHGAYAEAGDQRPGQADPRHQAARRRSGRMRTRPAAGCSRARVAGTACTAGRPRR